MNFRTSQTGTRREASTFVDGIAVPGASSVLNFTSSVQPLSGNEIETLPEGLRERANYWLYTSFELRTINQQTKTPPDEVILFGKTFIVKKVEAWQNGVINHYKVLVSEADD